MAFSPYKGSYTDYTAAGIRVDERPLTEAFVPTPNWKDTGVKPTPCMTPFGEGTSFKFDKTGRHDFLNTGDMFEFAVTDKLRQSVKLMVWVNDIDLIHCDHDMVHPDPQKGSATLWVTFSEGDGPGWTLQHTFAGSGWHELELCFNTTNTWYTTELKVNYSHLTCLRMMCFPEPGLEIKIASPRFVTYSSDYVCPEAPNGGRWISTCDCTALDGVCLSEWYNSSFDFEEKTFGESSVMIHGHREHEDFRVCVGCRPIPIDRERDVLCFKLFISDTELCGTNWHCRVEDYAPHKACIGFGYNDINNGTQGGLKNGWNTVRIPLSTLKMGYNKDILGEDWDDFRLSFVTLHVVGESREEEYVLRYDEMYVATKEQLGME